MKRHIIKTEKQETGSFYTKNAETLLLKHKHRLIGKDICDPFAGEGDLLDFAIKNGASSIEGYDIKPGGFNTRDSLMSPVDLTGKYLLTNPPYLCQNKSKDKEVYKKWNQNDKYKCHLASLFQSGCKEGTIILPSNFLSESCNKARDMFFSNYRIVECDYYYYPVFPNAYTGITVISFEKWDAQDEMSFNIRVHFSQENIVEEQITIKKKYNWLYGDEFFDYIQVPQKITFSMVKEKHKKTPNTKILISLLDKGKYKLGAHFNEKDPFIAKDKTFFTYQLDSSTEISEKIQKEMICRYNQIYNHYRKKYHGLFIANYMGADQKLKSVRISNMLLNRVYCELINS